MRRYGFSLIELMVVIAIVAVLAAVAVPAYGSYIIRTKVNTVEPLLGSLIKEAFIYRNDNGYFPDARELGYPEDPNSGGDANINPDVLSEYLYGIDIDNHAQGTCGAGDAFHIFYFFDEQSLGLSENYMVNVTIIVVDLDENAPLYLCGYFVWDADNSVVLSSDPYSLYQDGACTYSPDGSYPAMEVGTIYCN